MGRLASPLHRMQEHYAVVVVGSGYGGAITAYRIAAAMPKGKQGQQEQKVCLLERGRELHPGEYPKGLLGAMRHTQARLRGRQVGDRRALFDFHLDGDMNVLVGSGLGGTSLINANVAMVPDDRVFAGDVDHPSRWPTDLRKRADLDRFYEKARKVLEPGPVPKLSRKAEALAESVGVPGMALRADINVAFTRGRNASGVMQEACTGCGDCVTGCNVGAKRTVLMNYLPRAHAAGVEIFTEVEVRTVLHPDGEPWEVAYRAVGDAWGSEPVRTVTADLVVLSAGTLGTTEILLRSAGAGLDVSETLGRRFSGNGDVLGFAYDGTDSINGIGVADQPSLVDEAPGPCITVKHTVNDGGPLGGEILVEDAVVPRPLARTLRSGLALAALLEPRGGRKHPVRWSEVLFGWLRSPYRGPSDHTQTFLVMSHDGDGGSLRFDDDHDGVQVHWPNAGTHAPYPGANRVLRTLSRTFHARFVPNPAWSKRMGRRLLTVHPLGGAVMADSSAEGAVDADGRVFRSGSGHHDGLWVADGSMVPTPLGANPLFTISALAERTSERILDDLGIAGLDLGAAAAVEHERERQDDGEGRP